MDIAKCCRGSCVNQSRQTGKQVVNIRSLVAISDGLFCHPLILLFIPQSRFVGRPGTQVPGFDKHALRLVYVIVVVDLLHANSHAVLRKNNVLLLHLLRSGIGDLHDGEVDVVPDKSCACHYPKQDNEREELARRQ